MGKIAVMLLDNRADAEISSHFGKAPWIMIAERESGTRQFVRNEGLSGRDAAAVIADRGCSDAVVVNLGAGALRHLQMAGVSAWAAPAGITGSEALRLFAEGGLAAAAPHREETHVGGCNCGHGTEKAAACGHS